MDKILVILTAAIFFVYGLIFVLFPVEMLQIILQVSLNTSSGIIDIRATYGGMSIAIGVILYLLATNENTLRVGLISVSILMLSMAFGRLIGMVLDGSPNIFMYIYLALELVASSFAIFLLKRNSK